MGELDKVRSILFGEQIRVYEERMAEMDTRVGNAIDEMRRLLDERLQSMEKTLQDRLDGLDQRMETEQSDRKQLESLVTGDFKDIHAQFEKNQSDLTDTLNELKQRIKSDQKDLSKSLHEKIEALTDTMGSINQEKTNRTHLAQLLTHIAQELEREASD